MKKYFGCFILSLSIGACSKVDPKVDGGELVAGPQLSSKSVVITTLATTVPLSGTCDARSQSLQMSFDGQTWADGVGVASAWTVDCKSAKAFSVTLDLSNSAVVSGLGFVNGEAAKRTVQLRGMTKLGATKIDQFTIDYRPPSSSGGGQTGHVIVGGNSPNVTLSSGSFRMSARIGVPTTGGSLSSSGFRLRTGLQNQ